MDTLRALLRSRKFWLAMLAAAQVIALDALGADPKVWGAIAGVLAVLIGSIAHEDAARNANPLADFDKSKDEE